MRDKIEKFYPPDNIDTLLNVSASLLRSTTTKLSGDNRLTSCVLWS